MYGPIYGRIYDLILDVYKKHIHGQKDGWI